MRTARVNRASAPSRHTTIRLPASLRTELEREAAREGMSMNALITAILAGHLGWRGRARQATSRIEATQATLANTRSRAS